MASMCQKCGKQATITVMVNAPDNNSPAIMRKQEYCKSCLAKA